MIASVQRFAQCRRYRKHQNPIGEQLPGFLCTGHTPDRPAGRIAFVHGARFAGKMLAYILAIGPLRRPLGSENGLAPPVNSKEARHPAGCAVH